MKKITLKLLNTFDPCYDPQEIGFTKDLKLTPLEFIDQFRHKVNDVDDILWVLIREEFMSEKDQRLFAVWCARKSLKLDKNPDERSVNACDVAEKFANGIATVEDLEAALDAAWAAAMDARVAARDARAAALAAALDAARAAARVAAMVAARNTAMVAARDAARDAARAAASAAAWGAARDAARAAASAAQIDHLKTYFM